VAGENEMKTPHENGDLFADPNQPPTVTIKYSELFDWHRRAQAGEIHIQKMKCVTGGYELSLLWLNGRTLNAFNPRETRAMNANDL
jgi:hypothetical protein